jgi:LacI family transcriptional regulator
MKTVSNDPLKRISLVDSVYEKIKNDILTGHRQKHLSGSHALARELAVSRVTILAALKRLKKEGFIVSNGIGRQMSIGRICKKQTPKSLNIAILSLKKFEKLSANLQRTLIAFIQELKAAGHSIQLLSPPTPPKDNNYVGARRWLRTIEADAIMPHEFPEILLRDLLAGPVPVFAQGGAVEGLKNIAGVGYEIAGSMAEALQELFRLGHRRVVVILPGWIRAAEEGGIMKTIQGAFSQAGMPMNDYSIPAWEETPAGLEKLLTELFRITPPTAFVILDSMATVGTVAFLRGRGLKILEDISVVVFDPEETYKWVCPACDFSAVVVDEQRLFRHCVKWANDVIRGKAKSVFIDIPAIFRPGNTTGPPKQD